ncbi:3-keto-disaccharide hydrolase [Tamlana flava]|uniref:3-keto-disaccharide hydrolase n=1 Tax=Tamlana flava TaxID=3158572 RepID=UPI00351ADC69
MNCKKVAESKPDGFINIFNGKNLENWEGDPTYWRVQNGILVGEIIPETLLKRNTFIIWKGGAPSNFELKLDFKISDKGNSGINYRSSLIDTLPFALKGYQGDIDGSNRYTGMNYEERGRTTLAPRGQKVIVNSQPNPESENSLKNNIVSNAWQSSEILASLGNQDSLLNYIKDNDWNTFHIIAKNNRLQHFVNGKLMSDVTDNDSLNRKQSGFIGVQVHTGPPMKVEFKNIQLKTLNSE